MQPRAARLAPSPLRPALLLLVPLALLASVLLGLLAQSASAGHGTAPPPPTVTSGPSGTGTLDELTWTFDLPPDPDGSPDLSATGTVRIDHEYSGECAVTGSLPAPGSAYTACAVSFTAKAPTDGTYAFSVRTVDTVVEHTVDDTGKVTERILGVSYSAPDTETYVRDTTAPVVAVEPPTGPRTYDGWKVSVTDQTAVQLTCTLTRPDSTVTSVDGCAAGTVKPALLEDGTYVLSVSGRDAAGNPSGTVTSSYVFDGRPVVTISGPTSGSDTSPTFMVAITSVSPTAATCSVSSGSVVTCSTASVQVSLGADGSYTVTVTATDEQLRQGSDTHTYVLDAFTLTVTPEDADGVGNDATPSWTFTGGPFTRSTCNTTGGPSVVALDCGTGGVMATLPTTATKGTLYAVNVTLSDDKGNSESRTLTYRYDNVVDLTIGTPASPSADTQPRWTFTTGETVTDLVCALTLNDAPVSNSGTCSADGFTAATLTVEGTYVLTVTATDGAGNRQPVSSGAYVLDTTPAPMTLVAGQNGVDDVATPRWTFEGDTYSQATCRFASSTLTVFDGPCTSDSHFVSPDLTGSPDGTYVLTVTAKDAAGNAVTASASYVYDTAPPAASVGGQLPSPGNDSTPEFTYAYEDGATVTCSLVGSLQGEVSTSCGTMSGGAGTFTSADLGDTSGETFTFTITVTDAAGNAVTASASYVLDTVADLAPGTAPTASPETAGNDRTPEWTFTSEQGARSVSCELSSAAGVFFTGACTSASGFTAPTLPDTSGTVWTLRVTVVDALGNTSTTTLQTYLLDTVADLSVVDPPSPGNDTTPSWTFTTEAGAGVSCVLTGPGVPTTGSTCDATGYTAGTLPGTSGADYVLTVTVTDSLGNVTVYERPAYRLDTQLPSATITVPASPSREVTVTWGVVADESLRSATCQLRRDGTVVLSLVNCPGSTTVDLPGDGRYDLVVTLTDLAGNTSTTTSTVLVHDATPPPAPVVSPASTTTNATTANWTISAEAGISTTCRLTRGGVLIRDWTACSGSYSYPLPGDGSYLLEVVSTDSVGPGPVTSVTYLLDTVAPTAPQAGGPTGPSQSRTPSWTLSTESGTTTECRLVRGGTVVNDWAACAGGFSADLAALPDGAYVLESRATDAAGNVSAVGASAPYVLDTTRPLAPVVTGPSGPSQSRTPGFTWTGETGTRAECQLTRDGTVAGSWVACSSGYAPTLGTDGTWTLAVRLTDAAGNVSDPASSGGYVLDTTAPAAPVVTPPGTPGRDLAPSWGAVVEGGTALECRLTGADGVTGAWTACTMPHVTDLTGRPDGAYVLEVRATDAAGNLSAVGSGTYVLDTVAPAAAVVVSPEGPGRTRTPTFTFTTEAGATTRCRLTSGGTLISAFAPCTSPTSLDLTGLPDGTYTLTVRVTDAAGNPGPAATGTYVLDTTAPAAPVFTLLPATPSPSRTVTFAFSSEPGSALVCRLTFPTGAVREISGCSSPLTVDLSGLPDGDYTLTVRAVDAAGNVSVAATAVHALDSTALAAPELTGPVTPGSDRTPTWTLVVPVGSAECRLVRGTTVVRDWSACSGSVTADLFGQPDGTYALQARATLGGAVSATASSRYVLDTTPPAAATLVAPPTPSTHRRPTWSIVSPDAGATASCRVLVFDSVLRDWAPCAVSPEGSLHAVDLTGLGDGTYTLVVRLTDAAGNVGTTTASSSYVLDTSAPVAVGVTGPPSPGNDVSPTWTLSTSGGTELECRLSSAAGVVADWAPCAGEYTADLADSPDGTYTLAVRAVSAAGTPGPETTSAYVLSTTGPAAPTAVALSGSRSPSNDRSPTWTFTLPAGTTGHCRVVHGTVEVFAGACTSPFTLDLSSAGDGTYTLTVSAVDTAGNRTAAAPSSYVLDTEPTARPVFTLVPGATGSTLDPQWRFTAWGATTQCRLLFNGVALDDWASCTSPYTAVLSGRPDGRYVLQVRAVDDAGNTSEPVSDGYLLDRTAPPVATFTDTPVTPDSSTRVSWTVTAPGGSTLECRLVAPDGTTAWGPCGSGSGGSLRTTSTGAAVVSTVRLDLTGRPDGDYVLEVRVVQADGTRGAVSRATYRLDTVAPPRPAFTVAPPPAGNSPTPFWQWDAPADVRVECRLVRSTGAAVTGWAECAGGRYDADLTRLGQGTYALEVRLTDEAGNVGPSASGVYRYDTTAPAAPVFTSTPPSSGADRTVSWTFSVPPDATATCTVTRDFKVVRAASACSGRYDLNLAGLADGGYTLTVRYTDTAGNVGTSSSSTYVLATLRAGGPVRVDPPPTSPLEPAPGGGTTAPLPGPGRTGTGTGPAPRPAGSTSRPGVPTLTTDDDFPRSSSSRTGSRAQDAASDRQEEARSIPGPQPSDSRNPLLPSDLLDAPVPDVIRDVAIGTITRPTLPLALLAIVVLFLLAQNRIDRRDPKLAAAPVDAEPELDFTAFVRRPEGKLS